MKICMLRSRLEKNFKVFEARVLSAAIRHFLEVREVKICGGPQKREWMLRATEDPGEESRRRE